MPPNMQQRQEIEDEQVQDTNTISFVHHFWSKDKSGMTRLLNYIQFTHDDLQTLCTLFTQRSQLEKEYGEKLLALSKNSKQEGDTNDGIPAALQTVNMELKNTAHSHLDLSEKINNQVVLDFQLKLDEYKLLLEKWTKTLNDLYGERQEKIKELLKTRAKYLKEYDLSKGQSTSIMDSLKNQYKALVTEVDNLAQEWNLTWKEACENMEAMEEDRVEFLKSNVWDYANLASASLLVQDEWCENIRKQLEKCHIEEEIERCISLCATGSKIPTTNEYVGEMMREQKKKHQTPSSTAPKPPSKPPRQRQSSPEHNNKARSADTETTGQPNYPTRQYSNRITGSSMDKITHRRSQYQVEDKNDAEFNACPIQKRDDQKANEFNQYNRHLSRQKHEPEVLQQPKDELSYSNSIKKNQSGDNGIMNQIRSKVSDNMGSTAARGQIKRKPLNKSLMEQVTNEMEMAKQRDTENKHVEDSIKKNNHSHRKNKSNGSLDSLLKSFEGDEAPKSATSHPTAVVSEEAKSRRQPSEYKPDTGSIGVRRGIKNNNTITNRVLQEISPTEPSVQQQHPLLTHSVVPPKSPRPSAQKIVGEELQHNHVDGADPFQPLQRHGTSPNIIPSSSPLEHNGHNNQHYTANQNYINQHIGAPPYAPQQQQHMAQPQRSPMMQPQSSPMMQSQITPMMQPQRSPMIQPQRSPMIQPQRSPMMPPQRSPIMAPMLHSPMIQPQQQQQQQQHYGALQKRGSTLPPPVTIPISNYMASSPQPSPAISYSNLGSISPGGVLPPPQQQALPRPSVYSDGRPIQFWARAKYDYVPKEVDELPFEACNLIGILAVDVLYKGWWTGAIYDGHRQTWSIAASVPSNFMERLC